MNDLQWLARVVVAAALLSVSGTACSGKDKDAQATAEVVAADTSITERHEAGDITWDISPTGSVKAVLKGKDGQPIKSGVTASLTVKPGRAGPEPETVKLDFFPETGLLLGTAPKLKSELTEIAYDVTVDGKKLQGTLHVPRGGTKELVESAKEAADAKPIAKDTKGPNGGVVQVVGDDIVEIVADKDSGAARIYFLDDDLKVVPIGKRKGKLAFVGASAQVIDLDPDPGGLYLVGTFTVKVQPVKITVVVIDGDEVDVALCHWAPGSVVVVGPAAPVFGVFIVTGWPVVVVPGAVVVQPGVVVVHKGKGKKGKGKFKVKVW